LRKSLKITLFILLFFLGWYGINIIRIKSYSKNYFVDKSDVALVLGAGTSNGIISLVFKERMNHAINLQKSDKVKYIIITGGFGKGQQISDSEVAKQYAVKQGIIPKNIIIEEESKITFQNIKKAKFIMDSLDLNTALLVSDPYHMLRAHKMCLKMGINDLPSPTQTSMYRSNESKWKFLRREAFNFWLFQVIERFKKEK
jgi:uncharacterized SAM-binding protein YcdF (DUF218 family)